jgi:hypothetical protein
MPGLDPRVASFAKSLSPPTQPRHTFQFYYIDYPFDMSVFQDGATLNNGVYSFSVRDAVLGIYDLQAFSDDEFCWSYATTHQTVVLAALKIGETFDVRFDDPFERILHISRSHFPPGVPESGYGKYAVHLSNDDPRNEGFRIITAFEPQSEKTESRLPFFFGFRVFGFKEGEVNWPTWRRFLAEATLYARRKYWGMALINVSFALESFIDVRLLEKLSKSDLPTVYEDHLLRVGEKREEFHVVWDGLKSPKDINKYYNRINKGVFKIRNSIAHGRVSSESVSASEFVEAIKLAAEFVWDCDHDSRPQLVPIMHLMAAEQLIDEEIQSACQK